MAFLPKCNCGESISGVCNGKGMYCGSKSTVVWSDFINKHNVTEEEEQVDDVWWGVWEARKDLRIQFQIINEPGFSRR